MEGGREGGREGEREGGREVGREGEGEGGRQLHSSIPRYFQENWIVFRQVQPGPRCQRGGFLKQ